MKAYVVVLLLCAGPLGLYLVARGGERAPWPPPPLKPLAEKLDIVPARALAPVGAVPPSAASTPEPPLAEPREQPRQVKQTTGAEKNAASIPAPRRIEKPGTPKPASPAPQESPWQPVHPKSAKPTEPKGPPGARPLPPEDKIIPAPMPGAIIDQPRTNEPPVKPKQTPKPRQPEKNANAAPTPGTITDPEPIILPQSSVIHQPFKPAPASKPSPSAISTKPPVDKPKQEPKPIIVPQAPANAVKPKVDEAPKPMPKEAPAFDPPPLFEAAPPANAVKPKVDEAPMPMPTEAPTFDPPPTNAVKPKVDEAPMPMPTESPAFDPPPTFEAAPPANAVKPKVDEAQDAPMFDPPPPTEPLPLIENEAPLRRPDVKPEKTPEPTKPAPLPVIENAPPSLIEPPPPLDGSPKIEPPPLVGKPAAPENNTDPLFVIPGPSVPGAEPPLRNDPPRFSPAPPPLHDQKIEPEIMHSAPAPLEQPVLPFEKPALQPKQPLPLPVPPQPQPQWDPGRAIQPLPPRPLVIEPQETLHNPPQEETPAFRPRLHKGAKSGGNAPPPQSRLEYRVPSVAPMSPPPELQRKQPQSSIGPDMWKKDSNPGDEEETPAFRLVKPPQRSSQNAAPSEPVPPLNSAARAVTPGAGLPSLSVEKIGPNVARLGETISFELVVRNLGYQVANDLHVVDELPYGIRFVSAEPMPVKQGEKLTWALPPLHPGEPHRIRVSLQATAAGTFTSRSQVQYHVATQTQIRIDPADYVISVNSQRQLAVGESARIDIVVNSTASSSRRGLVLKAKLPESLAHSLGPRVETDVDLQPGESRKFTLSVRPLQAGRHAIEAWLEDGDGRFAKTQTEVVVSDQMEAPNAVADSPPPAVERRPMLDPRLAGRLTVRAIGTRILREADGELRVEIANFTAAPISNLAVTAALPAAVDFLDASDKGMYHRATKTIYWFVDNVAPGQTHSLVVRVRGKQPGRADFRVQAGTEAGKRALTQAPVVVEEQTSWLEPALGRNARLAFATKNGYKRAPTQATNETHLAMRIERPATLGSRQRWIEPNNQRC